MVMKDSKDVVDPRYVLQFMCHGTNTVMMCVCRLVLMIHFYARDPFWIICIEMFIRSEIWNWQYIEQIVYVSVCVREFKPCNVSSLVLRDGWGSPFHVKVNRWLGILTCWLKWSKVCEPWIWQFKYNISGNKDVLYENCRCFPFFHMLT